MIFQNLLENNKLMKNKYKFIFYWNLKYNKKYSKLLPKHFSKEDITLKWYKMYDLWNAPWVKEWSKNDFLYAEVYTFELTNLWYLKLLFILWIIESTFIRRYKRAQINTDFGLCNIYIYNWDTTNKKPIIER